MLTFLLQCFWFMLPAYFANGTPVVINRLKILEIPVDFNRTFQGKPIFGKNKTWRGLIFGLLTGLIIFVIQKWLYQFPLFEKISLINYTNYSLALGFLLSFGAIFGDLVKSFFKRRRNLEPGQSWFPFDQLDWILGALAFSAILYLPSWKAIPTITGLGFILHPITNFIFAGLILKLNLKKSRIDIFSKK